MPHFFFDLMNGEGWLADPEGMELANGSLAHAEAVSTIRSLIASEIREGGRVNLAHFMRIRDAVGAEISCVHFRDTVDIHDSPIKD